MLSGEHARLLVQRAYTDIEQGELVDTYARSAFADTRRKAARFGAMGSTLSATRPEVILDADRPAGWPGLGGAPPFAGEPPG